MINLGMDSAIDDIPDGWPDASRNGTQPPTTRELAPPHLSSGRKPRAIARGRTGHASRSNASGSTSKTEAIAALAAVRAAFLVSAVTVTPSEPSTVHVLRGPEPVARSLTAGGQSAGGLERAGGLLWLETWRGIRQFSVQSRQVRCKRSAAPSGEDGPGSRPVWAERRTQEDGIMSDQRGAKKASIRRISAQHPTAEEDLIKALQRYVRRVSKPAALADDAYQAVMKALGTPEHPPAR